MHNEGLEIKSRKVDDETMLSDMDEDEEWEQNQKLNKRIETNNHF